MKLDRITKYFRNYRDSYNMHATNKDNVFHLSQEENKKEQGEPVLKARYLAILMGFMSEFFLYYHRMTMSVSLVAMVNSSTIYNETDLSTVKSCMNLIKENNTDDRFKQMEGEFLWSPEIQGYLLGSSFLCYVIAMPFSSKLAEMYGGKRSLFCCLFFSSLFTCISPFAATWSVYALIFVQILRGISQSGILPSEAILIANWCPKQERGYSFTIAVCGSPVGAVVGSYLTGILCESALLGGWSSAFFVNEAKNTMEKIAYICSYLCINLCYLWAILGNVSFSKRQSNIPENSYALFR